MAKNLKLKHIIKYLDEMTHVKVWQTDVYVDKMEDELIFEGAIMDIPWYMLNYYLNPTEGNGAIDARFYGVEEKHKYGFVISVCEDKDKIGVPSDADNF